MRSTLPKRSENLKVEQKMLLKHGLKISESLETMNRNYKDKFNNIEQKYDKNSKFLRIKLSQSKAYGTQIML